MEVSLFRIGILAKLTGLSVRTLRFYDEIGLLKPSGRDAADHRVYADADVQRLQQIVSLRALGLKLEEIGDLLDGRELQPTTVIQRHIQHLQTQIQAAQTLTSRLQTLASSLTRSENSTRALLQLTKEIVMFERYFTPEQLEKLKEKRQNMGDEGMAESHKAWADVIADATRAYELGLPPQHPDVQAIVARRKALILQFTGGDAQLGQNLTNLSTLDVHAPYLACSSAKAKVVSDPA